MAPYGRIRIALGAVAGTAATTEWVLAQTATRTPEASASGIGFLVLVALVAIVLAVLITAVSLHDMKRRQEESAMILQARLSDALLLDPVLSEYPITATVHVPLWRRSPVIVDIAGSVASPDLRRAALDVVTRETKGIGREVRIEDRTIVNPVMAVRIARGSARPGWDVHGLHITSTDESGGRYETRLAVGVSLIGSLVAFEVVLGKSLP